MRYKSASDFRTALEARLNTLSRESGVDLNRLRRRVVFERLLARLERQQPGRGVLKGGMALEVRWRNRARSTRDLDLALRDGAGWKRDLRAALVEPLGSDPDGDWFTFLVGAAEPLEPDDAGRHGSRLSVEAQLAGRRFANVRVDVVDRPDELTYTERMVFPGLLDFADVPPTEVELVDRDQHFAEKIHAFSRHYASGPSTRVKDLADLVLLIDDGLRPNAKLSAAVDRVFAARGTHPVPDELPDPPRSWAARFADLASELDVTAATLTEAMVRLRSFWNDIRSHKEK